MEDDPKALEEVVLTRLMRLNATVQGIVAGLVAGLGLFIATNWLILKGGPVGPEGEPVIGPHLWLLNNYFPGYSVTFVGSLVGLAYGFAVGFAVGFLVATVYNWIVALKDDRSRGNA
jgi:hypothetical protein